MSGLARRDSRSCVKDHDFPFHNLVLPSIGYFKDGPRKSVRDMAKLIRAG